MFTAQSFTYFWLNLLNPMDKKVLCACMVDQDWSDSRLPRLDMVLLCLDEVRMKRVSWAVRYLDKSQWWAVRGGRESLKTYVLLQTNMGILFMQR